MKWITELCVKRPFSLCSIWWKVCVLMFVISHSITKVLCKWKFFVHVVCIFLFVIVISVHKKKRRQTAEDISVQVSPLDHISIGNSVIPGVRNSESCFHTILCSFQPFTYVIPLGHTSSQSGKNVRQYTGISKN